MANAEAKEAGAHEPKGRTKYKYITLSEAYESFPGAEVNCYGIVAEWTVPRPTRKGTDMYQVLKLRDASVSGITSTEDGGQYSDIQVQFFATSREELPKPRKKGDIIRLHRVKVGRWEGKPQLNAKIGTIMQGAWLAASAVPVLHVRLPRGRRGGEHQLRTLPAVERLVHVRLGQR